VARYLQVLDDENSWFFRIHLDISRVNSHRQPDSYWVIERVYLKDMSLEQIEEELARVVQYEIERRRAPRSPGQVVSSKASVHPLSGRML